MAERFRETIRVLEPRSKSGETITSAVLRWRIRNWHSGGDPVLQQRTSRIRSILVSPNSMHEETLYRSDSGKFAGVGNKRAPLSTTGRAPAAAVLSAPTFGQACRSVLRQEFRLRRPWRLREHLITAGPLW